MERTHPSERGTSLVEAMVAGAVLLAGLAFGAQRLSANLRAQESRIQLQGLDLVDLEFRQNLVSGRTAGLLAAIPNIDPALRQCLIHTGTTSASPCRAKVRHDVAFALADNPHLPPRFNLDARPCEMTRPGPRTCPFVLEVAIVPLCERDVDTCLKPQALMVDYTFRNLGGKARAGRSGRLLVKVD